MFSPGVERERCAGSCHSTPIRHKTGLCKAKVCLPTVDLKPAVRFCPLMVFIDHDRSFGINQGDFGYPWITYSPAGTLINAGLLVVIVAFIVLKNVKSGPLL